MAVFTPVKEFSRGQLTVIFGKVNDHDSIMVDVNGEKSFLSSKSLNELREFLGPVEEIPHDPNLDKLFGKND